MNPVLVDGVLWVPTRAERPGIIGDYMSPLDQSDPEYDAWMEEAVQAPAGEQWVLEDALSAAAWEESEHPRDEDGKFTEKGSQWREHLEGETSEFLQQVAMHNDEAAAVARQILEERGVPEPTALERWEQIAAAQQEEADYLKAMWASEPDRENDFYSEPLRAWADNEFGNAGRSTLPDDWQKGWTWGEDALAVDQAIYEQNPLSSDIAVWRGAYNESGEPSSRPISTSFSKYIAGTYADRSGSGSERHLHRVLVPAGSHVGWHTNEDEIVLPTGTILEEAGQNMWIARVPEQMVDEQTIRAAGWDEAEHPRDPGGEQGGQFIEKGASAEGALAMGLGPPGQDEKLRAKNAVPKEVEDQMEADLEDFLDSADLQMRMPEEALLEVLDDGEFYNQHQAQTARGMGRSVESEARMFGLQTTDAAQLPKYGYLGPDTQGVIGYGPVKVIFKDEVKDRSTFVVNDSLLMGPEMVIPSPIRDPSYLSANLSQIDEVATAWAGQSGVELDYGVGGMNMRYGSEDFTPDGSMYHDALASESTSIPYFEAQIYGKLTPDDIARVEVLPEEDWALEDPLTGLPQVNDQAKLRELIDKLEARGISVGTYDAPGDYSGEWA